MKRKKVSNKWLKELHIFLDKIKTSKCSERARNEAERKHEFLFDTDIQWKAKIKAIEYCDKRIREW